MSIEMIDDNKVKKLKGFKIGNEIVISDCDSMNLVNDDGSKTKIEPVTVVLEHGLLKWWIEECGLLEELGVDATVW